MVGRASPLPGSGHALGFDCLEPVRREAARAFRAAGYRVACRYLETLRGDERTMLHEEDLAILLVTTAKLSGLGEAHGRQLGELAVSRARALDAPAGLHVTHDSEANGASGSDAVAADIDGDAEAIVDGAFRAMLYAGAGQPLDARQLLARPNVHCYWRAGSEGIPEPACGWAVVQGFPLDQRLADILPGYPPDAPGADDKFDADFFATDYRGRRPWVWMPQ